MIGGEQGVGGGDAKRLVEVQVALDLAFAFEPIGLEVDEVVDALIQVAGGQGEREAAVAQCGEPELGVVAYEPALEIGEPGPLLEPVPESG